MLGGPLPYGLAKPSRTTAMPHRRPGVRLPRGLRETYRSLPVPVAPSLEPPAETSRPEPWQTSRARSHWIRPFRTLYEALTAKPALDVLFSLSRDSCFLLRVPNRGWVPSSYHGLHDEERFATIPDRN